MPTPGPAYGRATPNLRPTPASSILIDAQSILFVAAQPVAASVRCLMRRLFPVVTEVVEQIVWVEAGDFDADEEARLAGVERLIVEVRISGAPKPENCAHGTHEGGWSPTQCRLEERDPSNRAEASAAHRFDT